jgi:hypothetical protein
MQNETNENQKNFIFSIKAAALIECVEDNAELGKAMRKLLDTTPTQTAIPTEMVNQVSEEEHDENHIEEVTDPFNREEPIVRDYVLKEEPEEKESESPFGNFTFDERGLPINSLKPLKLKKGDYAFCWELKQIVEIEYGYWLEAQQENYYQVRFLDRGFYRFDIAESKLNKTNLEEANVTINKVTSTYTVSNKPNVKPEKPAQRMPTFVDTPKEIVREEKPKRKTSKTKIYEPKFPPMFKIGQRVLYAPDNVWFIQGKKVRNPNIKIGNIASLLWDSSDNQYKYFFGNETESAGYLKQECLIAINEEQEQKLRLKLSKTKQPKVASPKPTVTSSEIPSPKFKIGDVVQQIASTNGLKYEIALSRYDEKERIYFYEFMSPDNRTHFPKGCEIAEYYLELFPKEIIQRQIPKYEALTEEEPIKQKKAQSIKKVSRTTPTVTQNNAFRSFNEQFDFICEPYSIKQLGNIYNLIDLPKTSYKKSKNRASSNAFLDMVIEQINASKLLVRDSRGYFKLNKFIHFNKLSPNSLVYLKDEFNYTVTEYYRINPNNKSKKAYYRAEGNPKKISELAFYKKLFLFEYIDIERWRNLKFGKDEIHAKEVFQNENTKLTFKKSTAKVYDLKDPTLKGLVSALLFKKIQMIKAYDKNPENPMGVVKRKVGRPKKVVETKNVAVKSKRGRPRKRLNNQ